MSSSDKLAVVAEVNSRIAMHLDTARRALAGAAVFDVGEVSALLDLTAQMEAYLGKEHRFDKDTAEFRQQMRLYKERLQELKKLLEQIRMMLLAKRSQLESSQRHMSAVSQWTDAYQHTR